MNNTPYVGPHAFQERQPVASARPLFSQEKSGEVLRAQQAAGEVFNSSLQRSRSEPLKEFNTLDINMMQETDARMSPAAPTRDQARSILGRSSSDHLRVLVEEETDEEADAESESNSFVTKLTRSSPGRATSHNNGDQDFNTGLRRSSSVASSSSNSSNSTPRTPASTRSVATETTPPTSSTNQAPVGPVAAVTTPPTDKLETSYVFEYNGEKYEFSSAKGATTADWKLLEDQLRAAQATAQGKGPLHLGVNATIQFCENQISGDLYLCINEPGEQIDIPIPANKDSTDPEMMSLCNRYQAIFRHGPISIVPYSNPKGEAVKSLTSRLTLDQSKQIVLEANVLIPQLMQNNIDQASDKSLRDARRLLQQLSQIDLAAFENVPDPAAAARALRTNLETFINAYYASMREYFKNPLEAEYHPVGIVSNGALNCAYAAFVQIEANNKLLRRSLSEKQTMQAALERYSAASTDTPVPIDLEAIRNSLSGHLDAQASRQHDASEIAIRMYEGIGPTENGLVPLRDGPQQFYVSSSERVSDAGGGVPGWRDICEPGAQQATLRPPIIQVNYNLDALQNKSVLSLEDCLAQSYSADETAAPGLKKLGQQPATLLVGVARPYNGGRLDATPIDAPLYCQPEELFGLKQDPNDPNSAQYYTLQGFISYSGNSMNGHYVAYIQCGDEFYCLNGSTKTPVTQAVYLEKATRAVLLNYSQVVPKQRP